MVVWVRPHKDTEGKASANTNLAAYAVERMELAASLISSGAVVEVVKVEPYAIPGADAGSAWRPPAWCYEAGAK